MATKRLDAMQTKILRRFLSDKEYDSLYDSYKEACYKRRGARDINMLDHKIFKDYRAGMIISEIQEKYKKSRNYVLYSIALSVREMK